MNFQNMNFKSQMRCCPMGAYDWGLHTIYPCPILYAGAKNPFGPSGIIHLPPAECMASKCDAARVGIQKHTTIHY